MTVGKYELQYLSKLFIMELSDILGGNTPCSTGNRLSRNSGLSLPELMHFKINVKISAQPHTTTEIQSRSPKGNLF